MIIDIYMHPASERSYL